MAGRPKRQFTDEEKGLIEQMALDNCHLDTIAKVLSVPKQTLVDNFRTFIDKKRAEGRMGLRRIQRNLAVRNVAMAIFLGKNELDQTDRQEQVHGITDGLAALIKEIGGSGAGLPIKEKNGI